MVVTYAPTALEASSTFARRYHLIRILHREEQRILWTRAPVSDVTDQAANGMRRGVVPIPHVLRNSSGHASIRPRANIPTCGSLADLIARATALTPEESIIVWEPIASWLIQRSDSRLEEVQEHDL